MAYEERWGSEEYAREWLARLAPSAADDHRQIAWNARLMRASATPSAAQRFAQVTGLMDVRELLSLVHVPTLVVVREDVRAPKGSADVDSRAEAEGVAARIPESRFVVLPGRDYHPWVGDQESLVTEVAAFVTGSRPEAEPDRVLLTVLFTDVVDSTGVLARLGDPRWRELLAEHDIVVRAAIDRFRGSEVDHAGDGVLVTFDRPARAIRCAREPASRRWRKPARCSSRARSRISSPGSELRFEERPPTRLRGIDGEWRLYSLVDAGD